jgi:hypothetical protein
MMLSSYLRRSLYEVGIADVFNLLLKPFIHSSCKTTDESLAASYLGKLKAFSVTIFKSTELIISSSVASCLEENIFLASLSSNKYFPASGVGVSSRELPELIERIIFNNPASSSFK